MRTESELTTLFHHDGIQIDDIIPLSNKVCQVKIMPQHKKKTIRRDTNLVITAFVSAYSRIEMNRDIAKLINAQCTILYHDTDSLIFAQQSNQVIPLEYGSAIGQYKNQVNGTVDSFTSLGNKNHVRN